MIFKNCTVPFPFTYIYICTSGVLEIAAQALGRMAAYSGNRTEHIEFQINRSIEWLGTEKTEGRRHAAVYFINLFRIWIFLMFQYF